MRCPSWRRVCRSGSGPHCSGLGGEGAFVGIRGLGPTANAIDLALGVQRGVPVLTGYLSKASGTVLKGVDDPDKRTKVPARSITISGQEDISGQTILLLDDLYRSGTMLNACCNLLMQQARVKTVCVLTMTRTRTKR